MSLNRYFAELSEAFLAPLENPGPFLRTVTPWFALALIGRFAQSLDLPSPEMISFALNAVAMGGFAIHWQRFSALGQRPAWPLALSFGPRALAWALVYQLMLGVESAPAMVLAPSLATIAQGDLLGLAVQEAFQLLIGPMFLILPHIALLHGKGGARLADMVVAGGLAVGFGYVLSNLPFLMISQALSNLAPQLPAGPASDAVVTIGQSLLTFLAATVAQGFFARVWMVLRQQPPAQRVDAAAAEPETPPRPRRTERQTRSGKRRP